MFTFNEEYTNAKAIAKKGFAYWLKKGHSDKIKGKGQTLLKM